MNLDRDLVVGVVVVAVAVAAVVLGSLSKDDEQKPASKEDAN